MAASSKKLYGMKEACEQTGLPYETLKYYCNTGLVPNVKRSDNNRRVFTVPGLLPAGTRFHSRPQDHAR